MTQATVSTQISKKWTKLTETERKVAHTVVANYPMVGLNTISDLAQKAHVGAATVTRFVTRLGYVNFSAFREALRSELEAQFLSPVDKRRALRGIGKARSRAIEYLDEVLANLKASARQIQKADFDRAVNLLADRSRGVFIAGGRMSGSVARHMATTLHSLREHVLLLDGGESTAMEKIVDMRAKDVLLVLDFRRYQRGTIGLAQHANEKGCRIILVTDEWISPAAEYASIIFRLKVETRSIWDSLSVAMAFCEALVDRVGRRLWEHAERRLKQVERHYQSGMTFDHGGVAVDSGRSTRGLRHRRPRRPSRAISGGE
jgi:DNA-binding MurR/RpiR family transcriptional regulator